MTNHQYEASTHPQYVDGEPSIGTCNAVKTRPNFISQIKTLRSQKVLARNSFGDEGQDQARVGYFKVFLLQFRGIIQVQGGKEEW
uniref:Uncharacterized protein n=1 Tax=Solanum tuberosum TaxID=4113 RepID=M1E185_SOLTU